MKHNEDGPTPISKLATERKWDVALGGVLYGHQTDNETQRWSMSPDYSDADVKSAELGKGSSVGVLWSQLATIDFSNLSRFQCPVFMFAGAEDRITPQTVAKEFFDRIPAPPITSSMKTPVSSCWIWCATCAPSPRFVSKHLMLSCAI